MPKLKASTTLTHSTPTTNPIPPPPRLSLFSRPLRRSLLALCCLMLTYLGYYWVRILFGVVRFHLMNHTDFLVDNDHFNSIVRTAYISNFIGKAVSGILVDLTNRPKAIFVTGLIACVAVTYLNTFAKDANWFLAYWVVLKFFTSFSWGSVVKLVAAHWPAELYGIVFGLWAACLCFGETILKMVVRLMFEDCVDCNWQKMYYIGSGIAFVSVIPTMLFVSSKMRYGNGADSNNDLVTPAMDYETGVVLSTNEMTERKTSFASIPRNYSSNSINNLTATLNNTTPKLPDSLSVISISSLSSSSSTSSSSSISTPSSLSSATTLRQRLKYFSKHVIIPLLNSPRFHMLCIAAIGTTIIRETIHIRTFAFLRHLGFLHSSWTLNVIDLIGFCGCLATAPCGYLLDGVKRTWRGLIPLTACIMLMACQTGLYLYCQWVPEALTRKTETDEWNPHETAYIPLLLLAISHIAIWVPFSVIDSMFALEIVGYPGAAFASSIVGTIGYVGVFFVTKVVNKPITAESWAILWQITAGFAGMNNVAMMLHWWLDVREQDVANPKNAVDRKGDFGGDYDDEVLI